MLATPTAGDTFLKIEKGCLFFLTADLAEMDATVGRPLINYSFDLKSC